MKTKIFFISLLLVLSLFVVCVSATGISLYSHSPDPLSIDYIGLTEYNYIVNHSVSGVNYTSLAFLYGVNYTITSDYKMSIRVPENNLCDTWGSYGKILRQKNRNITPYLTWENNSTITEGNVYKWGGGDHNSFWITTNNINSTHTFVNISGYSPNVYPVMSYLSQAEMMEGQKTTHQINKFNGLLLKVWDTELISGRGVDYFVRMYIDSVNTSYTPGSDIKLYWANKSFNPATDDPTNTPYGGYLGSCNYSTWIDHCVVHPSGNASYSVPFIWQGIQPAGMPIATGYNYLYLTADVNILQSFVINITNVNTKTNVSFADTKTLWNRNAGTNTPLSYTPSLFMLYPMDHDVLESHLYIQDNDTTWYHSDIQQTTIGTEYYPPNPGIIARFIVDGKNDYDMTGWYTNTISVVSWCGNDPDGGYVNHSLQLYTDKTFIAMINASFNCNGGSTIAVDFDTSNYQSSSLIYHLRLITTDDEGKSVTTRSPNFQLTEHSDLFKSMMGVQESFKTCMWDFVHNIVRCIPLLAVMLLFGFGMVVLACFLSYVKRW